MKVPFKINLQYLDVIGSLLSSLCALHCLIMPFLYGVLPLVGLGVLGSRSFERAACGTMAALAAVCIWRGMLRHRRWWLLALWAAGTGVGLAVQWFARPECCAKERVDWTEAGLMFAAGACIAASHCLNLWFRKRCACEPCAPSTLAEPVVWEQGGGVEIKMFVAIAIISAFAALPPSISERAKANTHQADQQHAVLVKLYEN